MKIAIGSAVKGFQLKKIIKDHLESHYDAEIIDVGVHSDEKFVKHLLIVEEMARLLQCGKADKAIMICGTGMGMAIVANKYKGINAACCESVHTAKMSRVINNSNVLTMGEDVVGPGMACTMVDIWLKTDFQDAPVDNWLKDYWMEADQKMSVAGISAL